MLLRQPLQPYGPTALVLGGTVASALALRAVKRKSLTKGGALAAWIVGFTSVNSGLRGFVILFFYQIGTRATKYKKKLKEECDATAGETGVRGAAQVLACSLIAMACNLAHVVYCGPEQPIDFDAAPLASGLTCAVLAHNATCLADTLASELGMLAQSPPVLLTRPTQVVPRGTNGGVTLWGTVCSAAGGFLMALATIAMDASSNLVLSRSTTTATLVYGTACGVLGSALDSLLGATLQATFWDPSRGVVYHNKGPGREWVAGWNVLTNVQVNLISVAITTLLGGCYLGPLVFSSLKTAE